MPQRKGSSRNAIIPDFTLESTIECDNLVRIFDMFVDALDLGALGFKTDVSTKGAPSYNSSTLLKIYLYSYFNRIRSSRCIERECKRNSELWWLSQKQCPSYHTISTFRTRQDRDKEGNIICCHRTALNNMFKALTNFLDILDLLGKELAAIDGTKLQAQNSMKNHISMTKITQRKAELEIRLAECLEHLSKLNNGVSDITKLELGKLDKESTTLLQIIEWLKISQKRVLDQEQLLIAAQKVDPSLNQLCLTDSDARMMPINNDGLMKVAYNVQSAVDSKHMLIVHYSVENMSDLYLLGDVSKGAKEAMGLTIKDLISVLADKGYHIGKALQECVDANVETFVACPDRGQKEKGYQKSDFKYNKEADHYVCPQNQLLTTKGTWHNVKDRRGNVVTKNQEYRCSFTTCEVCPLRDKCLTAAGIKNRDGRTIKRNEYEEAIEANKKRMELDPSKYKLRQALVEHPFGTVKRSWGMYYTLLKGKPKVTGEVGLMFTVYNLRRIINILGTDKLLEELAKVKGSLTHNGFQLKKEEIRA
jgi:transposase